MYAKMIEPKESNRISEISESLVEHLMNLSPQDATRVIVDVIGKIRRMHGSRVESIQMELSNATDARDFFESEIKILSDGTTKSI